MCAIRYTIGYAIRYAIRYAGRLGWFGPRKDIRNALTLTTIETKLENLNYQTRQQ